MEKEPVYSVKTPTYVKESTDDYRTASRIVDEHESYVESDADSHYTVKASDLGDETHYQDASHESFRAADPVYVSSGDDYVGGTSSSSHEDAYRVVKDVDPVYSGDDLGSYSTTENLLKTGGHSIRRRSLQGHFESLKDHFHAKKAAKHAKHGKSGSSTKKVVKSEVTKEYRPVVHKKEHVEVREVCHDEPQRVCKKVPVKSCSKTLQEQCRSEPREVCKDVEKCKNYPNKVCSLEPKETCIKLPGKSCVTVQKEHCVNVPRQSCQQVPRESCRSVPRKECRKITVSRPRQVCPPPPAKHVQRNEW